MLLVLVWSSCFERFQTFTEGDCGRIIHMQVLPYYWTPPIA